MRDIGIEGVRRGKKIRTTWPDRALPCPLDRVNRQFHATMSNQLWVSDFTYVSTWQGFVYVAFVIDTFANKSSVGGYPGHNKRNLFWMLWNRRSTNGSPQIT